MRNEDQAEDHADTPLFVYGTLRKGFRAHKLLRGLHARFLGRGHTRGRLYDLGEYPGATESSSDADRVRGEVYILPQPEQAFRVLDPFEGYRPAKQSLCMYERKTTTVFLAGGKQIEAWIYRLREVRGRARRIPSGEYQRPGN
jgi:gamma-glutamylcyclotransferase (GGCT)/AIG2-like uncharacterized protein YtfP